MSPVVQSSKETAIVAAARSLFLRHGVRRVSVEEICRAAAVSKRTFYLRFRNKEELAIRVVGEIFDQSASRIEETLSADLPIEDKVRAIIAVKSALAAETSEEFYREIISAESELGRFARARQRAWDERVRRFYSEAKARGEIRADIDVDLLMLVLIRTRGFIDDAELARVEPSLSARTQAVMKLFFYGILPRAEVDPDSGR